MLSCPAAAAAILLALLHVVSAVWIEEGKLVPPQLSEGDRFGYVSAVNDGTLVVGALGTTTYSSPSAGMAYVFERDRSTHEWERAKNGVLTSLHSIASQNFGAALCLSGDLMIITSPGSDEGEGSALVFRRSGRSWTYMSTLQSTAPVITDEYGLDVACDGNVVVVGSKRSAFVYTSENGTLSQPQRLTSNSGTFGSPVGCSSDFVVVGAFSTGPSLEQPTFFFLYQRGGDNNDFTFVMQVSLLSRGQFSGGLAVHSDGTYVTVAVRKTLVGGLSEVHVYASGPTWALWSTPSQVLPGDVDEVDDFGYFICIDGDRMLITAPKRGATDKGGASLYERGTDSKWSLVRDFVPADDVAAPIVGEHAALSANTIVLSSRNDGTFGPNSGAVYTWRWSPDLPASPNEPTSTQRSGPTSTSGSSRTTTTSATSTTSTSSTTPTAAAISSPITSSSSSFWLVVGGGVGGGVCLLVLLCAFAVCFARRRRSHRALHVGRSSMPPPRGSGSRRASRRSSVYMQQRRSQQYRPAPAPAAQYTPLPMNTAPIGSEYAQLAVVTPPVSHYQRGDLAF